MLTGITGLDAVFGGGLLHGHSLLLQGSPGSGRTALGLQILANGALLYNEPGVILAVEQFPDQFRREANGQGWGLQALEAEGRLRLVFVSRDDLYSSFAERESVALSRVAEAVYELRARRVLIDPGAEFFRLPFSSEEQHKVFAEFVFKLKSLEVTPILTADAPAESRDFGPEEAAVDAILRLDHGPALFAGGNRQRGLEIVKARGQRVIEGRHPFRIAPGGIRVSPYAPAAEIEFCETDGPVCETGIGSSVALELKPDERLSSGINELDELLFGGLLGGSTTVIAGVSGTGKTVISSHFIAAGLENGEAGIYVSLFERPSRLVQDMGRRGLPFPEAAARGTLTVLHVEGTSLQPIEFYYELQQLLEVTKARRVVIDGLRQLLANAASQRERDYMMGLLSDLFLRQNVTALYTYRVEETSGLSSVASVPHTAQVDNVLYLGLTEQAGRLRRVLTVLKTRGGHADAALREVVMTSTGVTIANMTGAQSGVAGSDVLGPLGHLREFVHGARVETPEQARLMLLDLRREFDILAGRIGAQLDTSPGPDNLPNGDAS